MKISEIFQSNFIKAADLKGRVVVKTIDAVELVDMVGDGRLSDFKPVMSFLDTRKRMVLNKSNAQCLANALGDETSGWTGQKIEVFTDETLFMGKPVDGLRVRPVATPPASQPDHDDREGWPNR